MAPMVTSSQAEADVGSERNVTAAIASSHVAVTVILIALLVISGI